LAAPSVFGVFAAGSILLGAGGVFVESGMLAALIQRRDRLDEATHTAFVATVSGGVVLSLAALALSPVVGVLFSSREIAAVAAAMSGTLLVGACTVVPDALLQRHFSFLRRVVVDPLGVAVFGVVSIACLTYGMGVWGLVAATYGSLVAQAAAGWMASGFRPNVRRGSLSMWRELAGYGRFVLAAATINHVALAANTFLLGRFLSTSALGQYRYAARFGLVPQELAVNTASYVLLPAFSRISHDHDRFERAFERSLRLLLAAIVPLSLLLVPLGEPLVVLLVGDRWRPAGEALMALSVASAPVAAGSIAGGALKAAGRPDVLPRLHMVEAILSIALMLVFLPFGLTATAFGFALGLLLANVYGVVRTGRTLHFDLRRIARDVWQPYLAATAMIAFLLPLERLVLNVDERSTVVGLSLLAVEALVGFVVYLACLLAIAPRTAGEVEAGIRSIVRGRAPAPHVEPPRPPLRRVGPTQPPTFSVVMPAHDTASTVGAAIASVLAQTRTDFELLVVDDASSDGTGDVVQSFTSDPRVRLLRRAEVGGPAAARNDAFAATRAPFVSMLDSDDLWLPRYLETIAVALAANPSAGLACAGHWMLEEPPGLIRREPPQAGDFALPADEFLLRLLRRNFVANSTVTVRRSALAECGGCDSSLSGAVDLDLWLRLAALGHGAVYVGRPLAVYRLRPGSIQHDPRNELPALRNLRVVYAKVADAKEVPDAARSIAQQQLVRLDRRLSRLRRQNRPARAARAARRALGDFRDAALRRRIWYSEPPAELARALPPGQSRPSSSA
jgi:PST family polysaccharide transporter